MVTLRAHGQRIERMRGVAKRSEDVLEVLPVRNRREKDARAFPVEVVDQARHHVRAPAPVHVQHDERKTR
jgi:hypothetical protein